MDFETLKQSSSNFDKLTKAIEANLNPEDKEKNKPIPDVNWISQWHTLMQEYPKVKFIKVNPRGIRGGDKINNVVSEWVNKNVDYINFDELHKRFDCVSGLTK